MDFVFSRAIKILSSLWLCIRVHAREEIVHTEVGHGDTQEG